MPQLVLCLGAVILLIGSVIAVDLPFAFDENTSDLAGYDSNQLENASTLSHDLAGVPPVSSPGNDYMIGVSLVTNASINNSSRDNKTTESQRISSGLIALDRLSMANTTNLSSERFETDLQPAYSLMVLPVATPSSSDDWFNEGNTNYDNGDYAKAIICYDQSIRLNPHFSGSWCNKGMALFRLGKYQEAIKAFDKALKIDPNYAKALKSKEAALQAIDRENEAVQEE
ncbi:Tetratricopeptide repeat protein [uncultured archaeon]|nr:Tetratricopeptide repeat protein [uncultured archaeon]